MTFLQGFTLEEARELSWPPGKVSPCVDDHPPSLPTELTDEALALIEKYAVGKKSYLEWGAGGSTDRISRYVAGPAFSIDNHPEWCSKAQQTPYVTCRIKEGSMKFACVDTGPVSLYGNPANKQDVAKFANYVRANEQFGLEAYDFIFDDGRARVAVAYRAHGYMHNDSILVVHDYPAPGDGNDERHRYRLVEDYFELLEWADKAAVFRKRKDVVTGPSPDKFAKELTVYH
jgi:hypothetical protein